MLSSHWISIWSEALTFAESFTFFPLIRISVTPLSQDESAVPINIDKNNEIDFTDQSSEDENNRNSISDNQDFQDEFLNSFDDEVLEVEE